MVSNGTPPPRREQLRSPWSTNPAAPLKFPLCKRFACLWEQAEASRSCTGSSRSAVARGAEGSGRCIAWLCTASTILRELPPDMGDVVVAIALPPAPSRFPVRARDSARLRLLYLEGQARKA
ncbi:Hypothetical predicted protein [Podarcis lilfordi]|uniref:Uncharacterized protein n=1 Tax=Podarcis lilfordi TaxID=74358 RepID=A0AA35KPX6_9SAUR|nr:Hypothetical predicted protein [Podarcis lilfordi]